MSESSADGMSSIDRAFVWLGGGLFVASLAFCAWWYLMPLGDTRPFGGAPAVLADVLAFSAFALHHSVFARDSVKRAVALVVPDRLTRSVYVWIASALFIIVCASWRRVGGDIYHVDGPAAVANAVVQLLGVSMIAWSVRGLDPLELAGIHPATKGGGLQITGPYHWVRHPLYLGWALAVFGTAHMTGDRLAFAAITTVYLVLAIPFEEASLVDAFGEPYRRYQTQVRWRIVPYVY